MYIAVYNSNIIWVVNPQTLEIISSIRPDAASGSPRYLASHNGKVYASMYTGYVAQIDTVSMKIDRTITVGPNPEQLAVAGNRLYVANSDGDNYKNGYANCSISVIDLKSYAETKIQDAKTLLNPVDMVSNGTDVFVICKGNYSDIPAMVKKIEGDTPDKVKDVCGATNIAIRNNELFVIDAPYGSNAETAAYKVYDTKSCRELRDMVEKKVESPSTFAVDPVNGDIVIASYTLNASTGYAQYAEPGYANIYSADGTFKTSFKCGVGTQYITFTHSMK